MFLGLIGMGVSAVLASATNATGTASGAAASGTVVSESGGVASAEGGAGGYTYSWAIVSTAQGPAPSIISGGDTNNPTWRALAVVDGTPSISTWRVTVTDAVGNTDTFDITVTLTWINLS